MCVVSESGGFIAGYALLTAVGESVQRQPSRAPIETTSSPAPRLSLGEGALQQRLVRQLTRAWVDFEQKLSQVPIVARLESGQLTLEDYRSLLLTLRQQVVEGCPCTSRPPPTASVP